MVIGGGTGTYTVLSGLKYFPVHLSAIVSMADDGGSTRILREEFGVLPPGSVRPAMVALSNAEKTLADLFSYRFEKGSGLNGHNFGNLFITALTAQLGSFEKAIQEAGRILHIKGEVIPSTLESCRLFAQLENGKIVEGETNIDVPKHDGNLKIVKLWLKPKCQANPLAIESIGKADMIVIGPGDLFTSILPNFLVQGIAQAIRKSRAKKIYICNVMTKYGETAGYSALDFIATIEQYLGPKVLQYVLVNTTRPSPERIQKYEKEKSEIVSLALQQLQKAHYTVLEGNFLRSRGLIRHDPMKLASALFSLL